MLSKTWVPLLLVLPASDLPAATIVYDEDPALFGNLDQHNTDCPRNGCGPAAAVNSFVFLQNKYPVYDDKLVPAGDPLAPTQDEQAAVANTLIDYMKTCCTVGTYWGNFITGKQAYLDDVAPSTTNSTAESGYTWDPALGGAKPKPDSGINLLDNTMPDIDFILGALHDNQDLELLITDSDGNNGHFVTVTGVSWDTEDQSGYLSFVDPKDGQDYTRLITATQGEPLNIDYGNVASQIRVAVDESPTPEPGTFLMLGASLLGLAWWRRHCN